MGALKDTAKKILYCAGYYRLRSFLRAPAENRLLIIMYHDLAEDRIATTGLIKNGAHSQNHFAAHVRFLSDHYRIITVEEAVQEMSVAGRLAQPTVAITFDDGYASVYNVAWPILREYGLSATVYLTTDLIDGRTVPWWVTVGRAIERCDWSVVRVVEIEQAVGIPLGEDLRGRVNSVNARLLLSRILAHLRSLPDKDICGIVERLLRLPMQSDQETQVEQSFLNWDQVREMAASGIRFGAHTRTHRNMSFLDPMTAEEEIQSSKVTIAECTDTPVAGFAYPYGIDVTSFIPLEPMLKRHGFEYAVTCRYGVNSRRTGRYLLHRISLPRSILPEILAHTVSHAYYHR